jgi:hypothetical protein
MCHAGGIGLLSLAALTEKMPTHVKNIPKDAIAVFVFHAYNRRIECRIKDDTERDTGNKRRNITFGTFGRFLFDQLRGAIKDSGLQLFFQYVSVEGAFASSRPSIEL